MHRGVKFKIYRIPLIGLETRLEWRTDRKFLQNPNLNEIRFTTQWHYHTLHVFNVLSTFKHYFTQNMMFSSVNTYNFHSNVKEIKKISVILLFRQRVMASMIFTHRDNPKLLSDHVLTIFRSSCESGGGWGAFSFHMGKILWVSVLCLFQALF